TAVFRGYNNQMVGTLTGEETKGLNLLTEKNMSGSIVFEIDNKPMAYEVTGTKIKMDIDTTDPRNLDVSINIKAGGGIAEMFGERTLLDESYIGRMEDTVAEEIGQLAKQTIEKVRHEGNGDVLEIGKNLEQQHYDLWKK